MNSKSSKTFNPHRLKLKLSDKRNLNRIDKHDLSIYCRWKNMKKSYKNKL